MLHLASPFSKYVLKVLILLRNYSENQCNLSLELIILRHVIDSIFFVASEASDLIVASEASDLIFKIVIFHDLPPRSSSLYTGFSRTVWGRWRRFRKDQLTPPRQLRIS